MFRHMDYFSKNTLFPMKDFPIHVNSDTLKTTPVPAPHFHDFFEIVLVARGYGEHLHDESSPYGIMQGDLFAIPPGRVHCYANHHQLLIYNVLFDPEYLQPEWEKLLALPVIAGLTGSMSHKYHLKTNERVAAENLLREIASELSARGVGFRIRGRALLLEFLVLVARSEERGWHHVDYRLEAIHKAVIFMEQHLDEHLTLQDISRSAGLGKHYFREFFQLETGYSPWSYLLMLRLERAKKLLKESDLPILEVALKAGFCDQSYMARAFRRQEGITPQAYRMQFRRFQEIFPGNDATNHITLPDCPGIPAGGGDGRFLEKKEILPE